MPPVLEQLRGQAPADEGLGSLDGLGSENTASPDSGGVIILGALDKSLIQQVVKRHLSQIQYCYERSLSSEGPSLQGKVTVKFVVAKDGSVSTANIKSSTVNNERLESCVAGRFLRMKFPAPKGGGIVIVSYPFVFSSG